MNLQEYSQQLVEHRKEIVEQLKQYDALKEELEQIDKVLALVPVKGKGKGNRKPLSEETKKKMAEGRKKWWAEQKAKEAEEAAMAKTKSASKRAAAGG